MKFTRICLLLFATHAGTFLRAEAQTNNISTIQHVIVVIQENRTPDNLFHEDSVLVNHGADIIPAARTRGLASSTTSAASSTSSSGSSEPAETSSAFRAASKT
jgi:phospholipase C